MPPVLPTLHHVTATVAEAAPDVEFYTGSLGLRLVKKTVNFDNYGVYHLYYGDEVGRPSTLMTTFPYAGQGVRVGTKGAGQITVTSFSVPPGSLGYWQKRLGRAGLEVTEGRERFGEKGLMVEDPSGLNIEIQEGPGDPRDPWTPEGLDPDVAIRGVHGVTFVVRDADRSIHFATEILGLQVVGREGRRTRLAGAEASPGSYLEIIESAEAPDAENGLGTVHHVAMAIADEEAQLAMRQHLVEAGVQVTSVRDRQYFRSIYFREPGGILYEIATLGPGFTIDETVSELGAALQLPSWEEHNREAIEAALPPIDQEP
jgi:glyoxalase family protein